MLINDMTSFDMKTIGICVLFSLTSVTTAVEWPFGTYTLVKPKSGCPRGWLEGWRHQDSEDSRADNSITPGHHFAGTFGRNMKFYYCTKDPNTGMNGGLWPAGNYCILQHGLSCPMGFQPGTVHWDDEDSRNKNSDGGVLPTGSYGRNTVINYCCREDGSYTKMILLPTSQPFYLLRFSSPCQLVKGMYVREENVHFDDEDRNNKNSASGKHPMGTGNVRNQNLMYCYYSPL
eukprot:XP_011457183.1 PREDICTED: uncharacterized protein LOC105349191 [Crassostrea gigas]